MSSILTFWYSTAPSYGQLKMIFLLFGLCTTFIFWGIRYKAIRLVSTEENYSTNIGISYGVVGVVGLVVSFISIGIFGKFADPAKGFKTVIMFYAIINAVFAVLSFIFIPKFADEFENTEKKKLDFSELGQALKHPGVWLTTLCMFFVYTIYTSLAYTVSFLTAIGATAAIASGLECRGCQCLRRECFPHDGPCPHVRGRDVRSDRLYRGRAHQLHHAVHRPEL